MSTVVNIQNKLEILPGNIILLPGCEPTSAFTSPTLSSNMDCPASYISLNDAIAAIPNATVVSVFNTRVKTRYFVLPSGPPPTPQDCSECGSRTDWYQILKNNAEPIPLTGNLTTEAGITCVDRICEVFSINNRCPVL